MKSRLLFYIFPLVLFSTELAPAEEVFVLDLASQLQTIERKYMTFLENFDEHATFEQHCSSASIFEIRSYKEFIRKLDFNLSRRVIHIIYCE